MIECYSEFFFENKPEGRDFDVRCGGKVTWDDERRKWRAIWKYIQSRLIELTELKLENEKFAKLAIHDAEELRRKADALDVVLGDVQSLSDGICFALEVDDTFPIAEGALKRLGEILTTKGNQ